MKRALCRGLLALLALLLLGGCARAGAAAETLRELFAEPEPSAAELRLDEAESAALSAAEAAGAGAMDERLRALEARGCAAADEAGERSFVNADVVRDFFEQDGRRLDVFLLCEDGGLFAAMLYAEGTADLVRVLWQNGGYAVGWSAEYPLTHLELTEKGWLLYTVDIPNNTGSVHDGYVVPTTMLRLEAPDARCAAYAAQYLNPVGYEDNELFFTDWTGAPAGIDLGAVFLRLYLYENGEALQYYNTPWPLDGEQGCVDVPAEAFEALLLRYFDTDAAFLRANAGYSEAEGTYPVALGGAPEAGDSAPVPEVTAYRENPDGTLTLQVDAVWPEKETDCAFTHRLTLRPAADGSWLYLSNTVLPEGDDAPALPDA